MSCTATTTVTTASPTPVRSSRLHPRPLPADVLEKLLLKLVAGPRPPFDLPQYVLDRVLDFVPAPDLVPLLTVNKAFYLATKPQLFRELRLTKDFKVCGAGYDLVDKWTEDRSRPIFMVNWLPSVTRVLSIEAHDPATCEWLSSVNLPLLHTVRLPYDVHCSIASKTRPTKCGIHELSPVHVVHTDLSWHETLGTTSNFAPGSIESYTAYLAYKGLRRVRSGPDPMAAAYSPQVTIAYIFPMMPRLARRQHQARKDSKNRSRNEAEKIGDHPSLPCDPLHTQLKVKSYTIDTYNGLTGSCDHSAACIHIHFFNCLWAMNSAFWCNVLDSKASFVFVGLDEFLSAIHGDRQPAKRAHSHLAFLAKVQAGEFIELLEILGNAWRDVDPTVVAAYRAKFDKYHSEDGPSPFNIMTHKDWLLSAGADIAMLRKDLAAWRSILEGLS